MGIKFITYLAFISVLLVASVQPGLAQYKPLNSLNKPTSINEESVELKTVSANERKRVGTARRIALFATAIPSLTSVILYGGFPDISDQAVRGYILSVGFTGTLLGPSMGSLYANQNGRVLRGLLIRSGALGLTFYGAGPLRGLGILHQPETIGQLVMFLGAGLYIGNSIYDIIWGSRKAVEEYNKSLANQVSISPWVRPEGDGGGLQVQVRF